MLACLYFLFTANNFIGGSEAQWSEVWIWMQETRVQIPDSD